LPCRQWLGGGIPQTTDVGSEAFVDDESRRAANGVNMSIAQITNERPFIPSQSGNAIGNV